MEENKESYDELAAENKRLKEQLDSIEKSKEFQKKATKWILRKGAGVFLGKGLKDAIKQTITEFNEDKKVSIETASDLGAHIIWRITRIGIFAIVIAVLPTLFLIIQTVYLGKQNDKIDKQNELITSQNARLEQQTYLQEADRRSSLVFLSSNVIDKIDEELQEFSNKDRNLSDQLIGRIVSLTRSLKPYKYLEKDSLSMTVSPERGQLLINLVNANLGEKTYEKIYRDADFSYSELTDINFYNEFFGDINLSNSILENVAFHNCRFTTSNFSKSHVKKVSFQFCFTDTMDFSESFIERLSFDNFTARLLKVDLAFVNEFNFSQSFIFFLSFYESFVNEIYSASVYVDYFQFILNDGQLKNFFKHVSPQKYYSWKLLETENDFDDFIFFTDSFMGTPFLLDNLISENAIQGMDSIFSDNFKTVKIVSEKVDEDFDTYFNTQDLTTKKDSLSITYINEGSAFSREDLLEDIRFEYEEEVPTFDETDENENSELKVFKLKYRLQEYVLSNNESLRRSIQIDDYGRNSLTKANYEAFKKSKYYNSKN